MLLPLWDEHETTQDEEDNLWLWAMLPEPEPAISLPPPPTQLFGRLTTVLEMWKQICTYPKLRINGRLPI